MSQPPETETTSPMTPLEIIKRAERLIAIDRAIDLYKNDRARPPDDTISESVLYFKEHFFNHSSVKQWSDPDYELSADEAEAFEIMLSIGW